MVDVLDARLHIFHHSAAGMGGQNDVVKLEQRVTGGRWLWIVAVQTGAADLVCLEGLYQSFLIHDPTPCGVDKNRTGLHLFEESFDSPVKTG